MNGPKRFDIDITAAIDPGAPTALALPAGCTWVRVHVIADGDALNIRIGDPTSDPIPCYDPITFNCCTGPQYAFIDNDASGQSAVAVIIAGDDTNRVCCS